MRKAILKIISLFIAAAMLIALIPTGLICASAATLLSGTCGDNLMWELDGEGSLTITGTGAMTDYSHIYQNGSWITTSPWGSGIKTVTINSGVTSIGESAFYYCTGLTSVTIPESVTSIGDYAFLGCTGLTSVTICNGATDIGWYAFEGCTGLTSVPIPDGATSIGNGAFRRCTGLTSITIPDSVTSIGDEVFANCTGLTSVTIPDGVTSIGESTFCDCTGLTSVTIGNGVASIGKEPFTGCTGLETITVAENNPVYHSAGNCLIETDSRTLILGCKNSVIPADGSVTSIGWCAFNACAGLTSITIPDSVTSIGNSAFNFCTGLASLAIPDSVTSIGDHAFFNTGYYNDASNWENGVLYIGKWVIDALSNVSGAYTIKSGTVGIAGGAFRGDGLTSVTIPDGVITIGAWAFSCCADLTNVTIPDSVTSIGDYAFEECISLTSLTIPSSVTSIGECAFHCFEYYTFDYIPLDVTLRIYENSYAHRYAIDEGFVYELIATTLSKGDSDGDGRITVSDALAALRIAAKLVEPTADDFAVLDIDGDGKIAVNDALAVLRVAAKLVDSL